jgi:uncharacterized protein (TIGR02246 family)
MSADEQAIRDLIASWLRKTREGDVDAVLALMADDVVFLVGGQAPMVGKEAFAQGLRGLLPQVQIDSHSEIDEVSVFGSMAYTRTRLSVTMTFKDGRPTVRRSGPTLSILRKGSDGKWLLTRDANMLAPEPG